MADVPVNSGMTFTDINNAISGASLDDNIVFAPGTYNLTGSIQIPQRVNLVGSGEGSNPAVDTIIDMGGGVIARTIMVLANGVNGNPIEIRNMRLQNAPAAHGIYMVGISYVLIEDMYISGHNHAIEFHIGDISNITCNRVTTYDCAIGVKNAATMVNAFVFEDCHFDDGVFGSYINYYCTGVIWRRCTFDRNTQKGILQYYARDQLYEDCQVIDSGNVVTDPKPCGIDLGLKNWTHYNINFLNMRVKNCGGAHETGFGVWLRARSVADGYSGTVTGITFSGSVDNCPVDAMKIGMSNPTVQTSDVDISGTGFNSNSTNQVVKDLRDATGTDILVAVDCYWGQNEIPYGALVDGGGSEIRALVDPVNEATAALEGMGFTAVAGDVIQFVPWKVFNEPNFPVYRDLSAGIPGSGDDSSSGQDVLEQAQYEGKQNYHGINGKTTTIKPYGDALLPNTGSSNENNPSSGNGVISNWDDRG